MKVLIVDDEPYMVDYIVKIVDWKAYGFEEVLTARGGSMARNLLEKHRPDLLVTDIRMPNISGLDIASWIDENKYPTKVIILSGYSEFDYAKRAMQYGVVEYLVKPVLKEDFANCLERILERHFPDALREKEESGETAEEREIRQIRRYIAENIGGNLSLDTLGDVVHLNPSYLSRIFKEKTGENLLSYITDERIKKAAVLLEETDLKIHDVMLAVGYQKDQYFAKLFRERYGMTPKEYRREKIR